MTLELTNCPECNSEFEYSDAKIASLFFGFDYSFGANFTNTKIEFTLCCRYDDSTNVFAFPNNVLPSSGTHQWSKVLVADSAAYNAVIDNHKLDLERQWAQDENNSDFIKKELFQLVKLEECATLKPRKSKSQLRFFYQSCDGQLYFLAANCYNKLLLEYGECSNLPLTLNSKILNVETVKIDQNVHNRMKFLRHIPLGNTVNFVEIKI